MDKKSTNLIIIVLLLVIIGGGVFGFYSFQKNKDFEKQQECARSSARYLEKENKEYEKSNNEKYFFISSIKKSRYQKGFCYLEYQTYFNAKWFSDYLINVDSEEIISAQTIASTPIEYFEKRREIFGN